MQTKLVVPDMVNVPHGPNNAGNCHEFPSTHMQYGLYAHITMSFTLVISQCHIHLSGTFTRDAWLWILLIPYKEILAILSHIFGLFTYYHKVFAIIHYNTGLVFLMFSTYNTWYLTATCLWLAAITWYTVSALMKLMLWMLRII
jgi:hypothetical protein